MRSDVVFLCVCALTLCVLINCTISVLEFEESFPGDTPIVLESRVLSESVVHSESPRASAVPCSTEYLAFSNYSNSSINITEEE